MDAILNSLLLRSNVTTVDKKDLYLQLLSHNDYPSVKAVTDTLDYFGIDNVAANVPTSTLNQMPEHFLALLGREPANELVLVRKKKTRIEYTDIQGKKHRTSIDDFSEKWTGTLIAIEKEEKKQAQVLSKISLPLVLLAMAIGLVITSGFLDSWGISKSTYVALGAIGLFISFLSSKEELGIKDKVTTKVCGAISGDNFGCSNVINSREGKIFGILSLADLSLLFFASLTLYTIFFGLNQSIIYSLSLASIPVIGLSLYLQLIKLKELCLLCLLTSAVLLSQFVLLQTTFSGWDFSLVRIIDFMLVSVTTTFTWTTLKEFWKDSNSLIETKRDYYSFKRNGELFLLAIRNQSQLTIDTLDPQSRISFGSNTASLKITTVTNPFCGFCKEPFQVFDKLLQDFPEDVQITYVFSTADVADNPATRIAQKIISLYSEDSEKAYTALNDWYTHKDLEAWEQKYQSPNLIMPGPEYVLNAHRNWCKTNNIYYTPETVVNTYKFPTKQYGIKDLLLFIEESRSLSQHKEKTLEK